MSAKAIVIVEDNDAIAEIIKMSLSEMSGYTAVTVANGADALEVIEQIQANLLILDYALPGLSGIEVYDQVHARMGATTPPVLFVSANIPRQELDRRGLTHTLDKPFDLDQLHQKVAELLGDSDG